MEYPLSKYRFYSHTLKDGTYEIIAASTYAGREVKGRAKCHPEDKCDYELGKRLAAARCNAKIAEKRAKRARACIDIAVAEVQYAKEHLNRMTIYYRDAVSNLAEAKDRINDIMNEIKGEGK